MKKNILLSLLFLCGAMVSVLAQPYYLRGSAAPCDWGLSNPTGCELTDPDGNGIYELTLNLTSPIGGQECKIYNQATDTWYPLPSNAWYIHQGGDLTFRFHTADNTVDVVDGNQTLCAPGNYGGPVWTNTTPMTNVSGNTWCFTVPTPGTYPWKPTACGTWNSWEQFSGERGTNSTNWIITTTTPNEQVCVTYDPATGRVVSSAPPPTGIYLRGSGPLCGWNDVSPDCELTDPDGDGIYELTIDLGPAAGQQEWKVYNADTQTWYPGGPNAWYNHLGGALTFRYFSATGEVEVSEGVPLDICAPGAFNGWNSSFGMTSYSDGVWCMRIPNAGTYEWKPTVCGSFLSWNENGGMRSVGSDNWSFTTTSPNQQVCVTYDLATGLVTIRQRKLVLEGTQNASFTLRNMPFDRSVYLSSTFVAFAAMVLAFVLAIVFAGYELTEADIPGAILATPVIGYIIMLFMDKK